jgi:hypothetical protein
LEGDSGSPLVVKKQGGGLMVVGITATGRFNTTANVSLPSSYERLSFYYEEFLRQYLER